MGNIYFDPGTERAAKVNELFARIAPRYDLINDLQSFGLHRYWKRRVVQLAAIRPGERALDLCCGTGDLALALARGGALTFALDFSQEMLDVARTKRKSKVHGPRSTVHGPQPIAKLTPQADGKANSPSPYPLPEERMSQGLPWFVRADAQRLPFPDNTFDVVTVGYGLRNLANWETGLCEMRRVARPGGRLLALDFGKPDQALWRGLYFGYLRVFVPWLGRVFCGNAGAYAYILESLKHYPAQHGVTAKMRDLGLANVRLVNFLGGVMTINYGER
jgi:demethylmenaquinone methyltransferase/2-methoxy-6-polyprenyl-1,4-benzoquinol methylase